MSFMSTLSFSPRGIFAPDSEVLFLPVVERRHLQVSSSSWHDVMSIAVSLLINISTGQLTLFPSSKKNLKSWRCSMLLEMFEKHQNEPEVIRFPRIPTKVLQMKERNFSSGHLEHVAVLEIGSREEVKSTSFESVVPVVQRRDCAGLSRSRINSHVYITSGHFWKNVNSHGM